MLLPYYTKLLSLQKEIIIKYIIIWQRQHFKDLRFHWLENLLK